MSPALDSLADYILQVNEIDSKSSEYKVCIGYQYKFIAARIHTGK